MEPEKIILKLIEQVTRKTKDSEPDSSLIQAISKIDELNSIVLQIQKCRKFSESQFADLSRENQELEDVNDKNCKTGL